MSGLATRWQYLADWLTDVTFAARCPRSIPLSRILKRRRELQSDDLFITSYPRSGTTWFQMMLADLIQQQHGMTTETQLPLHTKQIIPDLDRGDALITNDCISLPFRPIKTHSFYYSPIKQAIVIFRRPASSLCSYFHLLYDHAKLSRNHREQLDIDSFCRRYMKEWSAHLRSYLTAIDQGRLRAFVLYYKQLHDAPIEVLQAASQFLDLPADREMCHRAVVNHTFHKRQAMEAKTGERIPAARFFRQGSVDGARDELSPETLELVECYAMPLYYRAQAYASVTTEPVVEERRAA